MAKRSFTVVMPRPAGQTDDAGFRSLDERRGMQLCAALARRDALDVVALG